MKDKGKSAIENQNFNSPTPTDAINKGRPGTKVAGNPFVLRPHLLNIQSNWQIKGGSLFAKIYLSSNEHISCIWHTRLGRDVKSRKICPLGAIISFLVLI